MFSRFPYNRQLTELFLFPHVLQTLAAAANDDAAVKAAEEHAEAARAKDDAAKAE
jgi:hypothetical protein